MDYAESHRNTMLVDLSMMMGDAPPRPHGLELRT